MVFVEPSSRIYKETEGSEWDLFDEWKGKAMVLFGYQFSGCPWFDQCLTKKQGEGLPPNGFGHSDWPCRA